MADPSAHTMADPSAHTMKDPIASRGALRKRNGPHMKTKRHRILLVDDDADERFLTSRALRKVLANGSTLNEVNSGDEAIAYMIGEDKFADRKNFPFPSLVITDLNMDHGDGFDVLEFMQGNPAWSVLPRIIYSSSDDDDDVRTSFLLGASAYHKKATNGEKVEKLLCEILAYWSTSHVPPVDETGRVLTTNSYGRRGERYPQPKGGNVMKRPGADRSDRPPRP